MAKKDVVSKRLAEEIALAKRIKDRIKDRLLDLANPDEKEELAASLWLNEKGPRVGDPFVDDPLVGPTLDAFKAFGLDHRNNGDWHGLAIHLARVLFQKRRRGSEEGMDR
jgi:hypothetical protein